MLHCTRMALPHPVTGETLDIRAPLAGGALRAALERLALLEAFEALMNAPWAEPPAGMPVLE